MSKEADKDVVESASELRPRRRRKKTGLRIPSDNVPRSTPVTPITPLPVAESGHAGPLNSSRAESLRPPSDGEVVAAVEDDPSVRLPASYSGSHEIPAEASARAPSESAATPPASRTAPRVELDDEATEVTDASAFAPARPQPPAGADGESPAPAGKGTADDDELETRKTRKMPSVNLDALGLVDATPADGEVEDSNDALYIPIEEGELEDVTLEPGAGRGSPRAATVALSDEDLEELIEPLEIPGRMFAGRGVRGRAQSDSGDGLDSEVDTRKTDPLPVFDEAAEAAYAQDKARAPRRPPEPGVPAAVAALESGGMESPLDTPLAFGAHAAGRPRPAKKAGQTGLPGGTGLPGEKGAQAGRPGGMPDPGDSGEILADDLIEEVDDSEVELEAESDRPGPPPAPRSSGAAKKPPPAPQAQARAIESVKTRRPRKPWFEEIFDEDYLRTLPFLTPQATQAEALFVADALGVEAGTQLLDVGCGYGRHAMELAARGYVVVALDLSLPLLLRGADEAQRRGLNINFVHGDMRELSFDAQFDGAYCLFSTFGYFDDDNNMKTLQGIARALKPGGRLVLEVLNRDYLVAELPTRVWWEGDGCVVLEEVDFNYFSSRIVSNRSVVFDDGRQLEQEISLRSYCLHELGKLLHGAGFRILEVSGSMATRGRFFGTQSREIIAVAEKPGPQDNKEGIKSSGS